MRRSFPATSCRCSEDRAQATVEIGDEVAPFTCQASQARLHAQPSSIPWAISQHFVRYGRPRADKTHLTLQDVEQLRQLVETRTAKPSTERSEPRVVSDFEHRTLQVVEGAQLALAAVGVLHHRSKFIEPEQTSIEANADLPEQHRPVRCQQHSDCRDREQRRQQGEEETGTPDIDHTFEQQGNLGIGGRAERQERNSRKLVAIQTRDDERLISSNGARMLRSQSTMPVASRPIARRAAKITVNHLTLHEASGDPRVIPKARPRGRQWTTAGSSVPTRRVPAPLLSKQVETPSAFAASDDHDVAVVVASTDLRATIRMTRG